MAKRAQSRYLSGVRSREWLKIKTGKRQEAVIVGFTAPRRTRPYFGALVLAVRDKSDWRYVGRVGTGFSHAMLEELHGKLWPLRTASSPFKRRVKEEATTTWVKPKTGRRGEVHRMDQRWRDAPPGLPRSAEDKKPVDVVIEEEQRRPA